MNPSISSLKIKIFSDGAEPDQMLKLVDNPMIKGMTTNPSLMKKAGVKDYRTFSQDMLKKITSKPISFEVFADDAPTMKKQAHEIATWGKNVYVKIPIINTEGKYSTDLIHELSSKGISVNVTAILTEEQVEKATKAVAGGAPSVISVFAGRIADTGRDPLPIMKKALELCKKAGPQCELLWASTRETYNIFEADKMGCHIITVPFSILDKLGMVGKELWDISLDTVKTFKKDSDSAGFTM